MIFERRITYVLSYYILKYNYLPVAVCARDTA